MTPDCPSKWLRFQEVPNPGRKTECWLVLAKQGAAKLGEVRWFGRWRQYAFFPEPETIFAGTCFTDLAEFIRLVTEARKA